MRELNLLAVTTGAIAASGLEQAMLTNSRSIIQTIVDDAAKADGVRSIYLLNPEGEVAASSGGGQLNAKRLDTNRQPCLECHQLPPESRPQGIVVDDEAGQSIFRTLTPIPNRPACYQCHPAENRLTGLFYMEFSMDGLNARLEQGLQTAFWGSVAIIVLSAIVLNVLLSRLVISPMERVAQGLRSFSRGQRTTRVPIQTEDEVGLLSVVYNEMADTIQTQEVESNQLYSELKEKDEVRRQLLARLITVQEEERRRVAHEIHDEMGQLLTGLILNLKLCQQIVPNSLRTVQDSLKKTTNLVQHTIDQTYGLITHLRPTVLDDCGLVPALQDEMKHRLVPLNIEAHLDTNGDLEDLPAEVTTATFRIIQEALTNIIRYAKARQVHIQLNKTANGLTVTIKDDGVGLPAEDIIQSNGRRPLGILGMQERADSLGGHLKVANRQSQGTGVTLWLPLNGARS